MSEGTDNLTRETLDAFADGELPPAEMTRVAALIEKRPDLRAYVESQERLRLSLRESVAPLMDEPMSERLLQLIGSSAEKKSVRMSLATDRLREFFTWNVVGPAAATLAAGLLVGILIERFVPEPFVASISNGQVFAQGELARALDDQLASNASPTEVVHVGLSFRNKHGHDCRTFEWISRSVSTNGIACHTAGRWNLAALVTEPRRPNDTAIYQTAEAGMPDAIRGTVSAMISGQPFDTSEERAARASHWAGKDAK